MTAAVALRKNADLRPAEGLHADLAGRPRHGRSSTSHPSVPATTLKEFIDYARANPGKLNYGTGNPLSILYNVQLMQATGIRHAPRALQGRRTARCPTSSPGRVHSAFLSTGTADLATPRKASCARSPVLLKERSPLLPEVPTIDEAGVPEVSVRQWAGVFGPPGMPREIVRAPEQGSERGAASARRCARSCRATATPTEGSTPERLLEINRDDLALWRRLREGSRHPVGVAGFRSHRSTCGAAPDVAARCACPRAAAAFDPWVGAAWRRRLGMCAAAATSDWRRAIASSRSSSPGCGALCALMTTTPVRETR